MKKSLLHILFLVVLVLTLFSLWAAFALLVVNNNFHNELPGYIMGRICIWEGVALIVAVALALVMARRWGYPTIELSESMTTFKINKKFAIYFCLYFFLGLGIAVWQFWLFSQKF